MGLIAPRYCDGSVVTGAVQVAVINSRTDFGIFIAALS